MSVPVTNKGAFMVATQVQPVTMPALSEGNHAFSKGHPLSLGATQIMIGVVILLSGIVMALPELTLAGYSFIFAWGAVMHITAGSLTVAAGKYDRTCLVNGAMAVSIASTVISLAGAVLNSVDVAGLFIDCHPMCSGPTCMCNEYKTLSQGFSAMLALLHLLMMAVSITVAAFACNATCGCCKPPEAVGQNNTGVVDQNMPVPLPVTNGGAFVVATQAQPVTMPAPSEGNHAFSRGHPLSLGATQIMIGVVILLFGIIMALPQATFAFYSFIFVWGAVMYIIAGSLTVVAGKYDRRCLVNGAMAVSIVSTVISLAGTALHSVDTAGLYIYCYSLCPGPNCFCNQFTTLSQGFSAILAVLHLLMMAVSITVAAFACNATCSCCKPPQPLTYVNPISEYASGDASRNPNVYFQPAAYIK